MKGLFSWFRRRTSQPDDVLTCAPTIEGMVLQLGSSDGVTRERARRALVEMGPRPVELLLQALRHRKSRVRFEAVMCLRDIADRRAIEGLVEALGDRVFEVRWVAAEGLIALGRPSVPPVLRALMERADSISSSGAPVAAARAMEHFPVVPSSRQEQHFAPH
jgi:HEAT repeat protein